MAEVASVLSSRRIGIIGAGRLGTALGRVVESRGYDLGAISARSKDSQRRAARMIPSVPLKDQEDVARSCDVLFITVADDAIEEVVHDLAISGSIHAGQWVVHLSGRCGLDVMSAATDLSAISFALHPAMTFAGLEQDSERFTGLPFGVTAHPSDRQNAEQMTRDLGGMPVWVPEADRVLYHAALCFGANNLITLIAAAMDALKASGIEHPSSFIAPLVSASLDNALSMGAAALTGPVRRGDTGTIEAHLRAFHRAVPDLVEAYRQFGTFTARRALAAELNDEVKLEGSISALSHLAG